MSIYVRELLFRRSAAVVAGAGHNPEARALMRELHAIGINLNQFAQQLNSAGELRDWGELREALDLHKQTVSRVLDL